MSIEPKFEYKILLTPFGSMQTTHVVYATTYMLNNGRFVFLDGNLPPGKQIVANFPEKITTILSITEYEKV